jgi:hypothetical protein
VARRLIAAALAAAYLVEVIAVMPPEEYRKARDGAQFHVQLEVKRIAPPARFPGECLVEGAVLRAFRGELAAGTPMRLAISCKRREDRTRPGGELWMAWEELERAKYLEAYVDRDGAGYAVAAWQSAIIAAPSAAPQFSGKD